jgi:hypothetical protein
MNVNYFYRSIDEKRLIAFLTNFKDEIIQSVDHWMGIVQDDFQHKLGLVVEGHQMLAEKLERVESGLGLKIDKITAEVITHRADTEAYDIYRVKER